MSTGNLSNFIFDKHILTEEELDSFKQILTEKTWRKGSNLTSPGDSSEHFYLIRKGVIRNFLIDSSGKEHTKKFQGPDGIIGPYVEFLTQKPAAYFIQAVTDCVVESFSIKDFFELSENSLNWTKVRALLAEASFVDKEKREIRMLSQSVLERYREFQKDYEPFMDQIPKYMIASYIGSTPEGLSRALK